MLSTPIQLSDVAGPTSSPSGYAIQRTVALWLTEISRSELDAVLVCPVNVPPSPAVSAAGFPGSRILGVTPVPVPDTVPRITVNSEVVSPGAEDEDTHKSLVQYLRVETPTIHRIVRLVPEAVL